jgi:hypothetical protein
VETFLLGMVVVTTPAVVWVAFSRVNKKLDLVHVLVNSKMDAALERIALLEKQLAAEKRHDA